MRAESKDEPMRANAILAGAIIAAAAAMPASAQSWGFGVEVGPPVYYERPPAYYFDEPPYYDEAPIVVVPERRRVMRYAASPDSVLDMLEDEGYVELSPMAERGGLYKLSAVSPEGDLVALEISVMTGEIEQEFILQPRRRIATAPVEVRRIAPAPPVVAPAYPPPAASAQAPAPMRDRLRPLPVEPEGDDPLVVY